MILLSFLFFVVCGTSLFVTVLSLKHAPVAIEDDNGFHTDFRA